MEAQTLRLLCQDHLAPLIAFLGLERWEIRSEESRLDGDSIACVSYYGEYRNATICFDKDKIRDPDHFLDVLAHELIHCVLSPIDWYKNAVNAAVGIDSPQSSILNEVCRTAGEMMVSNLEILWNLHLRDLYLDRRTQP